MGNEPVNVAIIGAGYISDYHVEGIRAAGGAVVSTLVGRNQRKTQQRALDLGIPDTSTDLRAILANDDIQAVVIATPDATHLTIAMAALEAGKNVLLQKPMAMTCAECRQILNAADRAIGRRWCIDLNLARFGRAITERGQSTRHKQGS